ncbi:MAG: iron chelate uptake ABC transporter family permease subunit [Oscillospiraceae bacterium]|jgi:iron complex transport system permease protein|nr:iron chelate uptake ABC transporter family permease subunit [Oscillospiraceae bacterium]
MTSIEIVKTERQKRLRRNIAVISVLAVLVVTLCALMLSLGGVIYPIDVIIRVLSNEQIEGATFAIGSLRLPRMLAGVLVGAAFGISGAVFQSMLRNPLASPDIIGVSSGASAAAVACILVFNLSGAAISAVAVVAGVATAALIYALSRGGSFSGGRLILVGIGVGAMLNSVISYLLLRASQYDVPGAMRWLSGSLNGIRKEELAPLVIAMVVLCPTLLCLESRLKIIELGDHKAAALGVRSDRTRLLLVLCAVGLVAFATAVTGPVAFVAFLSGPIAKRMTGDGSPSLLASALTGAALTLGADLLGQFAFNTKFPVGVITGIIGAPYLLFLLVKINRSGGSV